MRKPSSESSDSQVMASSHSQASESQVMASAQVVETSVGNNSPSQAQDSNHPNDLFQSRYVAPGFKPFSCYFNRHVVTLSSQFRGELQNETKEPS